MKIGILGPGAIGSLVGSLIFKSGVEVVFICRNATASIINEKGINIKSDVYGDFKIYPKAISASNEIFDVIFICVKSYELQNSLKLISQNIGESTIIISLLNGIGHKEIITNLNYTNVVIGTIGAVEVSLDENRDVIHSSIGKTLIEMATDSTCLASSITSIAQLLIYAGFSVNILNSEIEVIWGKLIRLAAISTMTSIARASLGVVRNNPEFYSLMENVVRELCNIAETQQFSIQPEVVLAQIKLLPERLTTSMQRDILKGNQSEIDAILGVTIRLGQAKGVSIPNLENCYKNLLSNAIS